MLNERIRSLRASCRRLANTGAWIRLSGVAAFGAPVYLHWSVFLAVGLIALVAISNLIFAALFIASYLAIIVVHELGHAIVARRFGYEIHSIRMTAVHGWCEYQEPEYEWHEVLVAWGGVAAQIVVALPILLIAAILAGRDWGYLTPIIVILGYLNPVVAIINLMPDDGLDGHVAWRLVPLLRARSE